jgi:UDP-N-acetylmuramate dehydrogenase
VDLVSGEDGEVAPAALGLRFRGSALADHQVVVSARFELVEGDRVRAEAEIAEIVRWRREHQPGGQNCGSVFVNPVPFQLSAGQVIDELGLRGLRIGTAAVSDKHANFIQADEGGSAADVRAVIETVRRAVLEHRGTALRSEVRLVGFEDEP